MQQTSQTDTTTTVNSGDNDVKETFWQPRSTVVEATTEQITDTEPKNGVMQQDTEQPVIERTTATPVSEIVENMADHAMPKLTRKQKAFADYLLNNPKASATQAAQETYAVSNRSTAAVIANENLRKPNIELYLDKQGYNSVLEIVDIARTAKKLGSTGDKAGAAYIAVALAANKDIADRAYGKATTRQEVVSTKVSINLDLTGANA